MAQILFSAGTGRTGLFIVTDVMNKMVTTGQEVTFINIYFEKFDIPSDKFLKSKA